MSHATAVGVCPGREPVDLAKFSNASGWAESIWYRLIGLHYPAQSDEYMYGPDSPLHDLWKKIEVLPDWQQVPLVLTFDTGVIPFQRYQWAADMLDMFDELLPGPHGWAENHLPAMAHLLRSGPEAPFVGVHGTSVTPNPFARRYINAYDNVGAPLELADFYVLGQHRDLVAR